MTDLDENDWGKQLSKLIAASEGRVASYKKIVQEAYKSGDRETVETVKKFQRDEEKYLKSFVEEKTFWNTGRWGMNFGMRQK